MDLGLQGRIALVTGGSQGIGAAVCRELARQGCDVALTFVGEAKQADPVLRDITGMGRRAMALVADSSKTDQTEAVFERVLAEFGGLDILVCNAGITRDGTIWNLTDAAWDDVIAVNLRGYFTFARAAARHFKDQKRGRIVNITSINGQRGKFGQANYAAAKGGVNTLTRTLARELGKFGTTVNAVAPGMVETEMAAALAPEYRNKAVTETVLGRLAAPEDIAHMVAFLGSDYAKHVTGQVINVDGGQLI
jgi:3-oxoacyl-[acyl-carrier protein] reductase